MCLFLSLSFSFFLFFFLLLSFSFSVTAQHIRGGTWPAEEKKQVEGELHTHAKEVNVFQPV